MNTIAVGSYKGFSKSLCFLFSGKAGVGKSYCADLLNLLARDAGLSYHKEFFAGGVKAAAKYIGWDGLKDERGRRLLQDIGRVGRSYDEDIWVRSTFVRLEDSVAYPYNIVTVDDWRFPNEYLFIQSTEPLYKPITVRVVAKDFESLAGKQEYDDVSETSLDSFAFDYVINNDRLSDIEGHLRSILNQEIENNLIR